MGNPVSNWWRSSRFQAAIKKGNEQKAQELLQKIEDSGAKLAPLEKLFQQKLKLNDSLSFYQRELASATNRLSVPDTHDIDTLTIEPKLIDSIRASFRLAEHDVGKIQVTGIEPQVFDELETNLAIFLDREFKKIPSDALDSALVTAIQDLDELEKGGNPHYNYKLSPYVYLLKYFPQSFYSNYLAWFLVYQSGLLSKELKILDIGAGLGTVAHSLVGFLQTCSRFLSPPDLHISYYSLEKEPLLQFRGLQFWRKSAEHQQVATNIYFRFDTADIFEHQHRDQKLPEKFFNFIVISQCFFTEQTARIKSHQVYQDIFQNSLASGGYVLLVAQGKLLYQAYQLEPKEDIYQEENLIQMFLEELGLELEWYKYVTSTGKRIPLDLIEKRKFAQEHLTTMKYLNPLKHQYLHQGFDSSYFIDSYIILAKKAAK